MKNKGANKMKQEGDRVRVISGGLKGATGEVVAPANGFGYITIKLDADKGPFEGREYAFEDGELVYEESAR